MSETAKKVQTIPSAGTGEYGRVGMAGQAAALWVCRQCHIWWGSQVAQQHDARLLLRLAEPYFQQFMWDDYRGWRVQVAAANVCPECGVAASQPCLALWPLPDNALQA